MARLGDYIQEEVHQLGDDGHKGLNMIGVSNERGLEVSTRSTSANLSRYIEVKKNWFAYNPMRINVGSIGLADCDTKTGYTSPDYTVFSCKKGLLPEYLLRFLKSDYGLEAIARNSSGAVRKRLYFSGLSEIELDIPSLKDQKHAIMRFKNAEHAARVILDENSDSFELPLLKQAILQEAIQGKLTADWRATNPDTEPASELLQRIQAEKAKLIAEKKIRKEKPLPEITPEEIPFEIPDGWQWCRFGLFVVEYKAGKSFKCEDRPVSGSEWGVLKTSAITSTHFLENENKFYSSKPPEDCSAQVQKGDLIFCRASGSKGLAGTAAIVEDSVSNLLLSDKTIRIKLLCDVSQKFIWFHNNSSATTEYYRYLNSGKSTTMNNITKDQLLSKPIPLPPLAEQAAIVERVKALMTTCRELEKEIEKSRTYAESLLQAVLKEAFAS